MTQSNYACEIVPTYVKRKGIRKTQINNTHLAVRAIRRILPKEVIPHYEVVGVIFLDSGMNIIGYNFVHKGGTSTSIVDVRLILQNALICNSSGIVLFHNHPGGNAFPSSDDIEVTLKLKKAGDLIGIELKDSIIITENSFSPILNFDDPIQLTEIHRAINEEYRLKGGEIFKDSKRGEIIEARQMFQYFAKKLIPQLSYAEIGKFGGLKRDHATVMHSCKVISNLLEVDKNLKRKAERIKAKILQITNSKQIIR